MASWPIDVMGALVAILKLRRICLMRIGSVKRHFEKKLSKINAASGL